MARSTITQTAGRFPRAPLDNDVTAEAVVDMLNAHAGSLDVAKVAQVLSVGPVAAKGTNNVHALYDNTTAAFPGPFTNPDVPRNLRIVKSTSWDGGTVTVTGTDQFDAVVSEVFPALTAGTEVGTKVFKTVTGAVKSIPAGVTGNGASIGTGDLIGLPIHLSDAVGMGFVAAVAEAITLDTTYDAFTPTTIPAATTYKVLVNVEGV